MSSLKEKTCLSCNLVYAPISHSQKFCCKNCKIKFSISEKNKDWLANSQEKKYYKPSQETSDKLIQCHAYNHDKQWLKKYKACRG